MRRLVWGTLLSVVLITLAVVGWASHRAFQVRSEFSSAKTTVTGIQAGIARGDLVEAEAGLTDLRARFNRAADSTSGPVWSLAQHLPVLGGNFRAIRQTALAGQILGSEVLPEATTAIRLFRTQPPLQGGRVDLDRLARINDHALRAARGSARARMLASRQQDLLLPPVAAGVTEGGTKLSRLDDGLQATVRALAVAPSMLGADGPRLYFVAVQNNAEARATGGLIGQFALVTCDRGVITVDRTGTDRELRNATTPVPSDPEAADTWTRAGSTVAWQDTNLTPHFPDVARNIAALWKAQGGKQLDGVLALDPLVLSELLTVTGPVPFSNGSTMDSAHVIDFVGSTEYARYPDDGVRKELLRTFAVTLFHRVVATKDAPGLMRALVRAKPSGHLFMWSAHVAEQAELASSRIGGVLAAGNAPYLSVLTQNVGGNKLDYYLRRSVRVTPAQDRFLRVQVTLRNTVAMGLPSIVVGRLDNPSPRVPYGQARVAFSIYGARSSEVGAVLVDGQPANMVFDRDHGQRMGTMELELPRDRDVTVTVLLSEPAGELTYRQQPLVRPDTLHITVPHRVVGR